ncbi:MAG: hypothetical protein EBU90_22625 [Proteobacteria bacterium]|nr:hypothetical protein [Pseudomonadota bacterium]NBP16567.1 hypothetical protein [bacterium]
MSHTENNIFDESHIGKFVKFYMEDGTLQTGKIAGIPNENHVVVLVDNKCEHWPWMVRSEAILFV